VLDPNYKFVTDPDKYLIDYDHDGVIELMVKFSREEVLSLIGDRTGEVVLDFTGGLEDGTPIEGLAHVTVKPSHKHKK